MTKKQEVNIQKSADGILQVRPVHANWARYGGLVVSLQKMEVGVKFGQGRTQRTGAIADLSLVNVAEKAAF